MPTHPALNSQGRHTGRCLQWLVLWLTLLAACRPAGQICESNQNCPADAACIEGTCQTRVCNVSADCAIEHFCDLTTGQCLSGCVEDSDCPYGESCESGQCAEKPCQSTELDCDVGEFCDTATGTCFEAAGPYCAPCKDTTNSSDCGGGNNICRYVAGDGPYCLVECSAERPCPAGYDCIPRTYQGNIISYNCHTLCQYVYPETMSTVNSTRRAPRTGPGPTGSPSPRRP